VMGRRPSAVATLVERRTRYLRLVAPPNGIKAVPVRKALVADGSWPTSPASPKRPDAWSTSVIPAARGSAARTRTLPLIAAVPAQGRRSQQLRPGRAGRHRRTAQQPTRAVLGWRTPAEAFAAVHWSDC